MKTKSITAMILSVMLMTMSVVSVFAEEQTSNGDSDVEVTFEATANYAILLPATIELSINADKTALEGSGDIKVKGTIGDDQYVELKFGGETLTDGVSDNTDKYNLETAGGDSIAATSTYKDDLRVWALEGSTSLTSIKSEAKVTQILPIAGTYSSTVKTVINASAEIPSKAGDYSGNTNIVYALKTVGSGS